MAGEFYLHHPRIMLTVFFSVLVFCGAASAHFTLQGDFCAYTENGAFLWDMESGQWFVKPATELFEVKGTQGNFCLIANNFASAWGDETKQWYDQIVGTNPRIRGTSGNFCVLTDEAVYAWDHETTRWYEKVFVGRADGGIVTSFGNFWVFTDQAMYVWDRETRKWTLQSYIDDIVDVTHSLGSFCATTQYAVYVWDFSRKRWWWQKHDVGFALIARGPFTGEEDDEAVKLQIPGEPMSMKAPDFKTFACLSQEWLATY